MEKEAAEKYMILVKWKQKWLKKHFEIWMRKWRLLKKSTVFKVEAEVM